MNDMIVKPSVVDAMPLARELYRTEHGTCGGCLHVILDDGNYEQEHAELALADIREGGCAVCLPLAEMLVKMSNTQRKKLSARYSEYSS